MKALLYPSVFIILAFFACKKEDESVPPVITGPVEVALNTLASSTVAFDLNPSGLTPLAGEVTVETVLPATVEYTVEADYPVSHSSDEGTAHQLPVLGLLPGTENRLIFKVTDAATGNFALDTLLVETDPLPEFFPDIEIIKHEEGQTEPGWNFVEMEFGGSGTFRIYPFIFDPGGTIRYYINLGEGWIAPVQRLRNGNWLWSRGDNVYETDILGREVKHLMMPGYGQHHDMREKPDGNLLLSVTKYGLDTGLDYVIELNRNTGAIVKEWDFRQVLDVDRFDLIQHSYDWLHVNSIWYDESDGGLVISGRHQCIFKVSKDNELIWILAPHRNWGQAGPNGNGIYTSDYLLTAVDQSGTPYPNAVQQGQVDAADFSWPWGQHAVMILPNGNILAFDNGWRNNFGPDADYSRAVEYEISLATKTVKQVWEYGRERGAEIRSGNISDVDYLPLTGNWLVCPGNIYANGVNEGRMIEVAYPDPNEVYEARIIYKNFFSNGSGWAQDDIIYRMERMPLYPE